MASDGSKKEVVIVGGGLVGCLLAVFLRKRGHAVDVYEKWPDMRKEENKGGRSINLVLTKRGLRGLEKVGLLGGAMELCVPVKGRMLHSVDGGLAYHAYGRENEWNNAISRSDLNKFLITSAEQAGATFHFAHELTTLAVPTSTSAPISLSFQTPGGAAVGVEADVVFGADGGGSATRRALIDSGAVSGVVEDLLAFGYKEIRFPKMEGEAAMRAEALHIWPRGSHMLMTLADLEGSFTGTVYLPNKGDTSFESLSTREGVLAFFKEHYADAITLAGGPDALVDQFLTNPVGLLGTVRCPKWESSSRVLLIGDAAHAIVPFFGQGCNCGFEDCLVLDRALDAHAGQWGAAIEAFARERKPDADAIANMALDNFVEMRDRVADQQFLLRKKVERVVEEKFPEKYRSRYAMVMYSSIPYHLCQQAGDLQQELLVELSASLQRAEDVDLALAERLVDGKFTPWVKQHGVDLAF